MRSVYKLKGAIKHYDWGSPEWIPALLGQPASGGQPVAELWLGTHPAGPAQLAAAAPDGIPTGGLDTLVAGDPGYYLGSASGETRLPYMLKALAAEKPLSIQAHPDAEQARAGFLQEEKLGIALDSPRRNYKDQRAKPEIVCALTEFTALCGFRPAAEIDRLLDLFGCAACGGLRHILTRDMPDAERCPSFLRALFSLPAETRREIAAHGIRRAAAASAEVEAPLWKLIARCAALYPEDSAVIAPLYLNYIVLAPGQAFFVPAGVPHAYLHGLCVEVMEASDNVLRGGLTPKHVDIEALLAILQPRPFMPEILRDDGSPLFVYSPPPGTAAPFRLLVCRQTAKTPPVAAARLPPGPLVALVTEGACRLEQPDGQALVLRRGESAFIAAGAERGALSLTGVFVMYIAAPAPRVAAASEEGR
jgi:mannose-6-phosphate isomerase